MERLQHSVPGRERGALFLTVFWRLKSWKRGKRGSVSCAHRHHHQTRRGLVRGNIQWQSRFVCGRGSAAHLRLRCQEEHTFRAAAYVIMISI